MVREIYPNSFVLEDTSIPDIADSLEVFYLDKPFIICTLRNKYTTLHYKNKIHKIYFEKDITSETISEWSKTPRIAWKNAWLEYNQELIKKLEE
jgi:hypothetical protein